MSGGSWLSFPVFYLFHWNNRKVARRATTRDFFEPIARLIYSPLRNNDVRWNFEKFLIDRKGKPVKRYDASTRVSDMRVDIESLLFPSVEFVYGS
jgi:glutathione peroxidase-family protein